MAIDDSRPLGNGHNLLSRNPFHSLNPPARPPDIETIHGRRAPEAEVYSHVILPEVARPGTHLADKSPGPDRRRHHRPDAVPVALSHLAA